MWRWACSARRMIAQARVVGWRARLSLFSSTTTFAPKMAYSSSRRTQLVQLGRRGDRLAGALAGGSDGPLADGFRVGGGHAQAVATEGFAQRRPGGAQLLSGG